MEKVMLLMATLLLVLATGYLVGQHRGMDWSFGVAASLVLVAVGVGAFAPALEAVALLASAAAVGAALGGISHEHRWKSAT